MIKAMEWMKNHKWWTLLIVLVSYLACLLIAHVPYWLGANMENPLVVTEIGEEDILSFTGTFIGAVATLFLGGITIYQNHELGKINKQQVIENKHLTEKMIELEERNNKLTYGSYIEVIQCTIRGTPYTNNIILGDGNASRLDAYVNITLKNNTSKNSIRKIVVYVDKGIDDKCKNIFDVPYVNNEEVIQLAIPISMMTFNDMLENKDLRNIYIEYTSCWQVRTKGICKLKQKSKQYAGDTGRELFLERYVFDGIE